MDAELYEIAGQHGFAINSNDGIYKRGKSYDITKKMEDVAALQATQHPNVASVSKQCKVSRTFVSKILTELVEHGKLLPPDQKIYDQFQEQQNLNERFIKVSTGLTWKRVVWK